MQYALLWSRYRSSYLALCFVQIQTLFISGLRDFLSIAAKIAISNFIRILYLKNGQFFEGRNFFAKLSEKFFYNGNWYPAKQWYLLT